MVSNNPGSNADALHWTVADGVEHTDADHPKHRMVSDGLDTGRAYLVRNGTPAGRAAASGGVPADFV
jgi:hypothetical protein